VTDLKGLIQDLIQLQVREPSLAPVLDELLQETIHKSTALVRRQPSDHIPQPGESVELTWEVFSEDGTQPYQARGSGDYTLIYIIPDARTVLPVEENLLLVRGDFMVQEVERLPNNDIQVVLREV